ncbi:MAG: PDZ domain-containing protein [Bacteroidaceae bacterium]|nr:PDZ domain-containing protein [Bacteroidaceae bacterium]
MKRITLLILYIAAVSYAVANENKMFAYSQNIEVFSDVLKQLNIHYVDTVDIDKSVKHGISAMLSTLDPYTIYFTEEEAKQFAEQNTGEYAGVGCTIMQRDSAVYISEPFDNTPAQEVGLKAGDKIVMIDNDTVLTWKSDEVSKRMRGLPNTNLRMVIERPGVDSLMEVNITRRIIQRNPVVYYGTIADGVGYIMLETFSDKASEEVRKAFIDLKNNYGITSLVLDLRDNGGGLVGEAIKILNMFLPRGTTVLESRGKVENSNHTYKTEKEPIDTKIPIAVLINGYTASASEVVAGALQDLDRAVIIGDRSFGKGLIQQVFPLPFNRQLKITVSYYYIPSGRSIQAIDYTKRDADGRVARMPDSLTNEFRTAAGRIVRDGGGITPDITVKSDTMSHLHYYLYTGQHIFDYATNYARRHENIAPANEFRLTDADYEAFKEFVHSRDFKYDKMSSKLLEELREAMTFEGYMDEQTSEMVKSIEERLQHNVNKDLDTFRREIELSLTQEIASRYYYQQGAIIVGLRGEPVTQRAIEILQSPQQYNEILSANKKAK